MMMQQVLGLCIQPSADPGLVLADSLDVIAYVTFYTNTGYFLNIFKLIIINKIKGMGTPHILSCI